MGVFVESDGNQLNLDLLAAGNIRSTPSGNPSRERVRITATVKRKRPKDLLASMTGYSVSEYVSTYKPIWVAPSQVFPGMGLQRSAQGFGCAVGSASVPSSDKASLRTAVNSRILIKIKDEKWNAANSIAEVGKTIAFAQVILKDVVDYYRLARKGDILGIASLYHSRDARGKRRPPFPVRAGSRYLAFRYGVRPLLMDLDSALAEFHNSNVKPAVRRVSSRMQCEWREVTTDLYQSNPDYLRTFVKNASFKFRKTMYFTVDPDVANMKRLGFTNLAAVLWEVTPYSFMFDWILPVGQFIGSLDAMAGVSVKSGFTSEWNEWDTSVSIRLGGGKQRGRTYSRSPDTSVSYLPKFEPSLDALKLLDTLSILNQWRDAKGPRGFSRF